MSGKKNIVLLTSHLDNDYCNDVCRGADISAREVDANLYVLPGRYLNADYFDKVRAASEDQYNTLFTYPNKENTDVLLVMLGSIATTLSDEEKRRFLSRYEGIPTMLIGSELEGYNCVTVDNRAGFTQEIEHLIVHHGDTKLGFVSGPMTNVDAQERLQVYRDCLAKHDIAYDEGRVVYGNFSEYCEDIVEDLLDRNPDLQGIVFANDSMAAGGYRVLKRRGIRIGIDIAVAAFDDAPFASKIAPNLTTVKADASRVGYQAVLQAMKLIDNPDENIKSQVETRMVRRESCGCHEVPLDDVRRVTGVDLSDATDRTRISLVLYLYLFHEYLDTEAVDQYHNRLGDFISHVFAMFDEKKFDEHNKSQIIFEFADFMVSGVLKYTSEDRIFNMVDILMDRIYVMYPQGQSQLTAMQLSQALHRRIFSEYDTVTQKKEEDITTLNFLIHRITQDMLMYDHDDDAMYGTVVDKLPRLNINSSFLYTYKDPIIHHVGEPWNMPDYLYLKAYSIGDVTTDVPRASQKFPKNQLFDNPYLDPEKRHTIIVSPLFSGDEHYGVLFTEMDYQYFNTLLSITNQLVAAIKIIHLLQENEEVQEQLQMSLEQIRENNMVLDELSKSDELTGVYNRRGFLSTANMLIHKKINEGRHALVIYADMDNLKIVNDRFGHEEGDYSLKTIARILKESLRASDTVARLGGDEFAALAFVSDKGDSERIIRERINQVSKRLNETSGKEYLINISMGFCEFVCHEDQDILELLDRADKKLYDEKTSKVKIILKKDLK